MFDFHNHFTSQNAFLFTGELLPQNIGEQWKVEEILRSSNPGAELSSDGSRRLLDSVASSEIGLDKRFSGVFPLSGQCSLLRILLSLAKEGGVLVSLHSVGTTGLMLDILRDVAPTLFSVLWHGFNGSTETAAILYRMGVPVSIGPRFSKTGRDLKAICEANPIFVLETDYTGSDEAEYKRLLSSHYLNCASMLGLDVSDLEKHVEKIKDMFTKETKGGLF